MPTVRPRTTLYLWEFLLQLLDGKESCPAISWLNRDKGEFVLKDQCEIAKLWGKVKGRPRMDKIKLGRAMRYYYKKKLLAKVPRRKAVYRFVKFDVLIQKWEKADMIPDDLPEIDLNDDNVKDLIGDETPQCVPLSNLNAVNDDDVPLETLLIEKRRSNQVSDDQECQKLFPMESNFQSRYISDSDIPDGFTDCNRNYCMNINSTCHNSNSSCNIKRELETNNLSNSFPPYTNEDNCKSSNQLDNCDGNNFLTSLLVENVIVSNNTPESTNSNANWDCQQQPCGFPIQNCCPQLLQTLTSSSVKTGASDPSIMSSFLHSESDMDSAFRAFKEIETLLMSNKLLGV